MDVSISPNTLMAEVGQIILGKSHAIRLSMACLLARGHLLIEDVPGVGKTTLAHTLARLLGLDYQRIQFTSDLLPSDITGVSVFEKETEKFSFRPGPLFCQLLLADEINRSTPKTQSALLEGMEERQVTIDGITHPLPVPFFVVATQNPSSQTGTFPLPQSQLDRFLARIRLGYPDEAAEKALLMGPSRRTLLSSLSALTNSEGLLAWQRQVDEVHASLTLVSYAYALIAHSRLSQSYGGGLSPRAGLGMLNMARAWAFLEGRNMVLPEDVQAVLPACIIHRLRQEHDALSWQEEENLATGIIRAVPVPS